MRPQGAFQPQDTRENRQSYRKKQFFDGKMDFACFVNIIFSIFVPSFGGAGLTDGFYRVLH